MTSKVKKKNILCGLRFTVEHGVTLSLNSCINTKKIYLGLYSAGQHLTGTTVFHSAKIRTNGSWLPS